ncbi:MAG TPA: hypothetical protein VH500_19875 [Nitrososphaeraceae archaeon]|jgi:hypothetical protein
MSRKQVSNYYTTNNKLHNPNQNIDRNDISNPHYSSINISLSNIQTKLKVSGPGDVYEQEADRIAEQVMRMPSNSVPYIPIKDLDKTGA